MRTISYNFFVGAGFTVLSISPILAIEAPMDDAPPPPVIGRATSDSSAPASKPLRFGTSSETAQAPQPTPVQEKAFLGVVTSKLPEILAEHLKLTDGQGILVRSLMPDGPAAKAGIFTNDIITRVGDRPIQTPEDLSNSISKRSPNDTISVQLIHKGEFKVLEITLAERPDQFSAATTQSQNNLNFDQLPEDLAERIRDALQNSLGSMDLDLANQAGIVPDKKRNSSEDFQQRMQGLLRQAPGTGEIRIQSGTTLRLKDQNGCIEIKSNQGSKDVTLHNPNGEIVWAGPWNTEQDKDAAPPEIRKRIESMNLKDCPQSSAGLQLKIPQAAAPLLGAPR